VSPGGRGSWRSNFRASSGSDRMPTMLGKQGADVDLLLRPPQENVRGASAERPFSVRSLRTCNKTGSKTGFLKSRGGAELRESRREASLSANR
jgi:hypothetical protein